MRKSLLKIEVWADGKSARWSMGMGPSWRACGLANVAAGGHYRCDPATRDLPCDPTAVMGVLEDISLRLEGIVRDGGHTEPLF